MDGLQSLPEVVRQAVTRYVKEAEELRVRGRSRPPRVITVARSFGARGAEVARRTADLLGWQFWDREILDVLASESCRDLEGWMFESLDERGKGTVASILSFCISDVDEHAYMYLLDRAIVLIAQEDAVIVGRGADLILPNAFHVFITASLERRVAEIAARRKLSRREAHRLVRRRDRERRLFRKRFAACCRGRRKPFEVPFDLQISTDRMDLDTATETLRTAALAFFEFREAAMREESTSSRPDQRPESYP